MTESVRRRRPPFAMVPEALLDGVSDRAVRLYAMLDRYAGTDEKAWPSRATMARRLECSEDSVDRAVKELTAAGWLVVHKRQGPGASNLYEVLDRPSGSRTHAARGSRTGAESVAARVRHERKPVKEKDARASQASPLAALRTEREPCGVCGGASVVEVADGSCVQCECVRVSA